MNPFEKQTKELEDYFMDWPKMYPKSYNKKTVSPFTKVRIILLNGTEFESNWFLHQFARNCNNAELKKEIAIVRNQEQQQQKRISCLKPLNENMLEETIGYEQLAIELTAILARNEPCPISKAALDFALLEDFDHLYRYSNLLDYEYGTDPQKLVGGYTEIMPARPTIAEHRYPFDSIFPHICNKKACLQTKLNVNIITAAEQQTMNYYMNVAPLYCNSDLGRRLYTEIGMIEEEHVSQYESLKDTNATWLEDLLLHEYTECYLYYSCMQTECDRYIRRIWEECLIQEIAHLHKAKDLLWKYEKKDWQQVIPDGTFPSVLVLGSNIEYVRNIIATTTGNTQKLECVVPLNELKDNDSFFYYQNIVNNDVCNVASHETIAKYILNKGRDYRYEVEEHPICVLRDRTCDNTSIARIPCETPESTSVCGTTALDCTCTARDCNGIVKW